MKHSLSTFGLLLLLAVSIRPIPAPSQSGPAAPAAPGTPSAGGGLAGAVASIAASHRAAWIAYKMPAIEGHNSICCFDSVDGLDRARRGARCCATCRLEDRQSSGSFDIDDDGKVHLEAPAGFEVLLRVAEGKVGKVHAFSEDCALDPGGLPLIRVEGVTVEESLDYLQRFVGEEDADRSEQSLGAIALHAGPGADRLLERFVSPGQPREVREHASFWIGVSRGRPGYEILKRLVTGDPDGEFRKKVLFALSQNPTPEATDTMIAAARNDRESDVRGEAIFWLAQKAGEHAARVIKDAIDDDPDTEVKKKAVFALSQLPADEGVPLLIDLARRHRNPAVRKEAIFWLGQSGDPRALDFIEQVLKG